MKYKLVKLYHSDGFAGYRIGDIITKTRESAFSGCLDRLVGKKEEGIEHLFFLSQLEKIEEEIKEIKEEKEKSANTSATGSLRFNSGKVDPTHIDFSFVMEMAQVLTLNEKKYPKYNYAKGQAYSTSMASLIRHLNDFMSGKDVDDTDGADMLAKIAVNAIITYCTKKYHLKDHPEYDDRINKVLGVNASSNITHLKEKRDE